MKKGTNSNHPKSRTPIKTTHKEIKEYWEDKIYEGDTGIDWEEGLVRCWRCGNKNNTKSLHRCHIIPNQKDGKDEPKNFVLLCGSCHEEAPSFYNDTETMWIWIKQTSFSCYGEYDLYRVSLEFETLFGRKPNSKFSRKKFDSIMEKHVGIHLGNRHISYASFAFALKKSGA